MTTITNIKAEERPVNSLHLSHLLQQNMVEPVLVLITLLTLISSLIAERLDASENLILTLNIISYLAGGYYATRGGLEALIKQRQIDVDLLMIAAAVGAALVNQWHEGATLLFLFSLSNVLQNYAIGRSRKAIQSLLKLRPDEATVRLNGATKTVSIDALRLGDVIVIRPGERIAADGKVISGSSAVDQATITGESMPVQKEIGDTIFAGTVNTHGTMDATVTKLASESTLARIITMVEEAQERHSTTQRRLDRFEQTYAKIILSAVALMIVIPPLLFNADFDNNFYRSMVLLVVASPCALVISTPASILSAIANAARQGILFKGGAHLEDMAQVKVVAFDKTGTITVGQPRVTDILPYHGVEDSRLLSVLASVESVSEHPIARAILQKAQETGLTIREPEEFTAKVGRGLIATLDGQQVIVGSTSLMNENGLDIPDELCEFQTRLAENGKTPLLVHAGDWLGVVGVADQIRPDAKAAIQALREAGIKHIAMLTGDKDRVAAGIAKEVGLDSYYADLLPEEKVDKVRDLESKYGAVAMVGDGVNDAPALATAHTGIAMGAAGTDVALETADVVLMSDDLKKIAYAINLSHRARRIVRQNLTFAMGVIVVLVIATLLPFVHVPLPLGVVGHEGSTIVVVMNGLRLLVKR